VVGEVVGEHHVEQPDLQKELEEEEEEAKII
jgi:hypothetical protein